MIWFWGTWSWNLWKIKIPKTEKRKKKIATKKQNPIKTVIFKITQQLLCFGIGEWQFFRWRLFRCAFLAQKKESGWNYFVSKMFVAIWRKNIFLIFLHSNEYVYSIKYHTCDFTGKMVWSMTLKHKNVDVFTLFGFPIFSSVRNYDIWKHTCNEFKNIFLPDS